MGIGVNTGSVIAGTVGGGGRLEYTVVGDAVNVAQRLQSEAEGGEIVAAASTIAAAPGDRVRVDRPAAREGPRGTGGGVPCRPRLTGRARSALRPARWPWLVLGVFVVIAAVGAGAGAPRTASPSREQVPYVVAFAMFGAVGALIVSRDRGNTIGLLLLWRLGAHRVVVRVGRGHDLRDRPRADRAVAGVLGRCSNNFGWLFGILPMVFLLPLLFPDGRLPSPRWRPFLWFLVAFLVLLGLSLALRAGNAHGLGRRRLSRTPSTSMPSGNSRRSTR